MKRFRRKHVQRPSAISVPLSVYLLTLPPIFSEEGQKAREALLASLIKIAGETMPATYENVSKDERQADHTELPRIRTHRP